MNNIHLYDDGRIACDDDGVIIRWYYLWGHKRIPVQCHPLGEDVSIAAGTGKVAALGIGRLRALVQPRWQPTEQGNRYRVRHRRSDSPVHNAGRCGSGHSDHWGTRCRIGIRGLPGRARNVPNSTGIEPLRTSSTGYWADRFSSSSSVASSQPATGSSTPRSSITWCRPRRFAELGSKRRHDRNLCCKRNPGRVRVLETRLTKRMTADHPGPAGPSMRLIRRTSHRVRVPVVVPQVARFGPGLTDQVLIGDPEPAVLADRS